jgi:hypothetical protein
MILLVVTHTHARIRSIESVRERARDTHTVHEHTDGRHAVGSHGLPEKRIGTYFFLSRRRYCPLSSQKVAFALGW